MSRNKYLTRRVAVNVNNEQLEILRLFSEQLKLTRSQLFGCMLQNAVCVDGACEPSFTQALALVRAPYRSSRYWQNKGQVNISKGDERLVGEAKRWDLDMSHTFWNMFFECSEGIRPAHEFHKGLGINMQVEKIAVWENGEHVSKLASKGPTPRNRDEYTRLITDENGQVPLKEPGSNRREKGFALKNKYGSHSMLPFLKALCMHTFSTDGMIPAVRAIMIACWIERFAQYIHRNPGFHPECYDDKWRNVNRMLIANGEPLGARLALTTPQACLQTNTPPIGNDHPFWGFVAPQWRTF